MNANANDTPPAADRGRRKRSRPTAPRRHPADAQLEQALAELTPVVHSLLSTLSTAAVSLLRKALDEEFERGRLAGLAEHARRTGQPAGGATIRVPDPPPPGHTPATAAMAAMAEMAVRR